MALDLFQWINGHQLFGALVCKSVCTLFDFARIRWWIRRQLRSSFVRSCWMSMTCWPIWTSLLAFLCQLVEILMPVSYSSWLTRWRWRLIDSCWLMQSVYCFCLVFVLWSSFFVSEYQINALLFTVCELFFLIYLFTYLRICVCTKYANIHKLQKKWQFNNCKILRQSTNR